MKKRRRSIAAKLYICISITLLLATAGAALLAYSLSTKQMLLTILAIAVGMTVLALLIVMFVIRRTVLNPLHSISQEMKKFQPSNTDYESAGVIRLELKHNDELSELYDDIRTMQINIIDHLNDLDKLQKDKEKADEDIKDLSMEAYLDPLTGTGNKTAYAKRIAELNRKIGVDDAKIALVMVDLNNLKQINDQYGHKLGDQYINGCCRLVRSTFMHSPVYRIGGDEFVVILQDVSFADRFASVEALQKKFLSACSDEAAEPWERYSAAVGMSEVTSDDQTMEPVFRRADKAMYEDKQQWKASLGSYR